MADQTSLEGYSEADLRAMAQAYHQLASNPETRRTILQAQKKLNPTANIPEIDIQTQIDAAVGERDKKIEAQEDRIRESEARERIRESREKLRGQGLTDADITAIETLMVEEKKNGTVFTYDTAATYYRNSKVVAAPTAHQQMPDMNNSLPADFMAAAKKGTNALRTLSRTAASKAIDDIRAGRIKLQ